MKGSLVSFQETLSERVRSVEKFKSSERSLQEGWLHRHTRHTTLIVPPGTGMFRNVHP